MIYGNGSLEKDRLRLEKEDGDKVFLARMSDEDGSYRLLVTAPDEANAHLQVTNTGDEVTSVHQYDIDTGAFI